MDHSMPYAEDSSTAICGSEPSGQHLQRVAALTYLAAESSIHERFVPRYP
jgi:hypothetical protein